MRLYGSFVDQSPVLPMHAWLFASRSSILSLLFIFVVGGFAAPAAGQSSADEAARRAPDFALEQMNGDTFHLSEHRGEVVGLNVWATWCAPCRDEIPGFVQLQLHRRHRWRNSTGTRTTSTRR